MNVHCKKFGGDFPPNLCPTIGVMSHRYGGGGTLPPHGGSVPPNLGWECQLMWV